jgi:hypothetical protein
MLAQLTVVVLAILLGAAAPGLAQGQRPNVPSDLDANYTTTNIVVHYRTSGDAALTQQQAGEIAAAAELALSSFAAAGFPRPLSDGDGGIDVYYFRFPPEEAYKQGSMSGYVRGNQGYGYIRLNSAATEIAPQSTVKHEIFHLVQFAITRWADGWLLEATAEWARYSLDPPQADALDFAYFLDHAGSLDCFKSTAAVCAGSDQSYGRWLLFAGSDAQFIREVFDRVAALGAADARTHGLDTLIAELTERGTTLESILLALGVKMTQGTLPYPSSRRLLPLERTRVTPPRNGGRASPAASVKVNHAALAFTLIDTTSTTCSEVPLALELKGPTTARAAFAQRRGAARPLALGTTVVPWIACDVRPAQVVFANGTTDLDGQAFSLKARVVTPRLSALKVARRTTRRAGRDLRIPIRVQSTAAGQVLVGLSDSVEDSFPLAAGDNRLTLKVPRSFEADRATLSLTPSVGAFAGVPLRQNLRFRALPR